MRGLGSLVIAEFRLLMREPATVFFGLAFPLLLLLIFGSIFGNKPEPRFGGLGQLDMSVQGYLVMVIGTACLMGIPITVAAYRELGILKRLKATPLHPAAIIVSQIAVNAIVAAAGSVLLLLAGWLLYDLRLPDAISGLIGAWVVSYLAFATFGFILGGIVPNARAAQAAGSVIFFPQLFLSGSAGIPRQLFPDTLRTLTEFLPMTQAVELIESVWRGFGWDVVALVTMAAIGIISTAISIWTFRWE